jgi:hypothetical protein
MTQLPSYVTIAEKRIAELKQRIHRLEHEKDWLIDAVIEIGYPIQNDYEHIEEYRDALIESMKEEVDDLIEREAQG